MVPMDERPEISFSEYATIREGLYHPELSRCFDDRTFEEGNPRADILSVLHGPEHKERRRLENPLFRREALVTYERELFPRVLQHILSQQGSGATDLFRLAGSLAVVLAAKRAGVDHSGSLEELGRLWDTVLVIAQASAILDIVGDRDEVQAEVSVALSNFGDAYVLPSLRRRAALLDRRDRGEDVETPDDLLTRALEQRRSGEGGLSDDVLVREAALYLHGGSHTSAQTTCNAFYYLLGMGHGVREDAVRRAANSPLDAQRAVHETLRMRPTTPRVKRLAVADLELGGRSIAAGTTVVFDIKTANRDPARYGERAEQFDPYRSLAPGSALWGLSFGAGPHICIGRSVAGGFPLQQEELEGATSRHHLYGLVALMVQSIAACGVELIQGDPPALDTRTDRGTRWARFPVRLEQLPATVLVGEADVAGRDAEER